MFKKSVLIPVILMLLAAISWYFVVSKERALAQAGELASVLTARVDLPAGTLLKEELVEVTQIPRLYLQQDAYEVRSMSDIKLVAGLAAAVRIPKGNQITQFCLVNTGRKGEGDKNLLLTQRHYLEGLKYFQSGDYEKASEEWLIARKLDPRNKDAEAGLERIKAITGK